MNFLNRLGRLEKSIPSVANQDIEFRVAGKSRSEIRAEAFARLFTQLERAAPGLAARLVQSGKIWDAADDASDSDDGAAAIRMIVGSIRNAERQNPGLAERVLVAVLARQKALTEELLFPTGRPNDEETYASRQGEKFCLLLMRD